ncbi:carboxylesterase [Colletotrichum scovillei]|uniref:Carboxylesterase n=1 Tax=Colletotrichum scovillei TaxID=1209932 RepID=A0A9P7RI49_9PEZI|nr:carboxylesterase [Colletotrichum scovillei]KAG7077349.1 carboxylesterase [Colletotrichum scovillei]KAG7084462.1 carboxylesterase [Colletotrichum scovillei]
MSSSVLIGPPFGPLPWPNAEPSSELDPIRMGTFTKSPRSSCDVAKSARKSPSFMGMKLKGDVVAFSTALNSSRALYRLLSADSGSARGDVADKEVVVGLVGSGVEATDHAGDEPSEAGLGSRASEEAVIPSLKMPVLAQRHSQHLSSHQI